MITETVAWITALYSCSSSVHSDPSGPEMLRNMHFM